MKTLLTLFVAITASYSLLAQPVITSNPKDASLCLDSCVMLTAKAVGSNVTYQWQQDTGGAFVNIATTSAATDTLVVCQDSGAAPDSAHYRCIATDDNGFSDTTNVATVYIDSCLAPVADFTFTFEQANVCFTNTSLRANSIIWNFGDGNTDNTNNNTPCNDYGTAWYYDVTLYAYNDHGSDEKTVTLDLVGLEEAMNHMEIFPNPVVDEVKIKTIMPIDQVHVVDILGNAVLSLESIPNIASIDCTSLPAGSYVLLIKTHDQWMQHRLIKQ